MVNKLLFIGIATFLIQGCATPYSKFYHDHTEGVDITKVSWAELSDGEPRLFRGDNGEDDSLKMLEDGYMMVGYSNFNAGNVNENGAISQAKKVHAAAVIIYSQYTNTVSGSMPLTLPDTQTSTTSLSGNAYGSGGYANYSGTAYTTTYGTKTTYIPYSVRRSDYAATYWVKLALPIFGAFLVDLTTELRKEIGSNKGMLIHAVINDSPAFQADIFRGDILRSIGGIEIYSDEKYVEALKRYQGQTIDVLIYRDGSEIEKEITLNMRKDFS